MRKASTRLPEQGTQAPSPAPDLIPAKTENQLRTYPEIGPLNGGTSAVMASILAARKLANYDPDRRVPATTSAIATRFDVATPS